MSSRGSWSSLFNSNVRQLIGSGADPARDGGHAESVIHEGDPEGIPVPGKRTRNLSDVDYPRTRSALSPQRLSPGIRSDSGTARSLGSVPSMPVQGRRPTFSQVARAKHPTVRKSVVVVDLQHEAQQEL